MSGLREMAKLSDDEETRDGGADQDAVGESDEEEDERDPDGVAADDEGEEEAESPAYVEPKRRSSGNTPRARRTLPTRRCKLPPGVVRDENNRIVDILGLLEEEI